MVQSVNPLTPELNPPRNAACRDILLGILILKGLTARRHYKSFGVKRLKGHAVAQLIEALG
jgi:hypothetical protein